MFYKIIAKVIMFNMKPSPHYIVYIPTQTFWEAWSMNKASMKYAGVRVTKLSGKYYVLMPKYFNLDSI